MNLNFWIFVNKFIEKKKKIINFLKVQMHVKTDAGEK